MELLQSFEKGMLMEILPAFLLRSENHRQKRFAAFKILSHTVSEAETQPVLGKDNKDDPIQRCSTSTQLSTNTQITSIANNNNDTHQKPNPIQLCLPPIQAQSNQEKIQSKARDRVPGREEEVLQGEAADPGEEVMVVMVGVGEVERLAREGESDDLLSERGDDDLLRW